MFAQFTYRAKTQEWLDDLDLSGSKLTANLDELAWINHWLGGNSVLIHACKKLSERFKKQTIEIVDLGCGGGDSIRAISIWAKERKLDWIFEGLDANPHVVAFAQEKSKEYSRLNFRAANIWEDTDFEKKEVWLMSLFLHHFSEEEIYTLLIRWKNSPSKALIINDLQRHWIPYYLFKFVGLCLRLSPMSMHDGAISIRKGFTRKELKQLMEDVGCKSYELRWCWAFRYRLIIWNA